ncbi:MAG: RIP metalloprotease RseP [Flavobacteriaceae bacterium]|nr:RIP metalloprotease RseP [Flavobacteriaceae bacterium]
MEIFIKASQLLLSLSLLIVLHELGHFIPAKIFKTRVEKFYLFFDAWGKKLFSFKKGGTEYGVGWLPLGGYVKISGMIDESMDLEQMEKEPQPWEFRSKPAWQRLIVMLGGVIVNFILGFLIYIMLFNVWGENIVKSGDVKYGFGVAKVLEQYGVQQGDNLLLVNGKELDDVRDINNHLLLRSVQTITVKHTDGKIEQITLPEDIDMQIFQSTGMTAMTPRFPFVLDSVAEGSNAEKAGLLKTDKIVAVNGTPVKYWSDVTFGIQNSKEFATIKVNRNNEIIDLKIPLGKKGKIGIQPKPTDKDYVKVISKEFSFSESILRGSSEAYWKLHDIVTQFKFVFTSKGATSLGGFIAIGNIFPSTWSWPAFWAITAFLSLMLGFMNLLPIPALDGGHVLFTLWEMITGRKPSDKFLEYAQIGGFIFLMGLLLLANGNDVYKWITGQL